MESTLAENKDQVEVEQQNAEVSTKSKRETIHEELRKLASGYLEKKDKIEVKEVDEKVGKCIRQ